MTKAEAFKMIRTTSSGTIAAIIGNTSYKRIDQALGEWIETAVAADDNAFENCQSIWDIVAALY